MGRIIKWGVVVLLLASNLYAADSYIRVPDDSGNTGKKAATISKTDGSDTVQVSRHTIEDPTTLNQAGVTANGALKVDGSAVTQPVMILYMPSTPVTGTFYQATQPVSSVQEPSSLGAKTTANSMAVTIASDQIVNTISTTTLQAAAGIYNTNTPNQESRVMDEPHQLMVDGFDTALDTTNRWNAATTSGTGAALAVVAGSLVVTLPSVAGYAYTTSIPSFTDVTPGQIRFAFNAQFEATPFVASTYRFWGAGTVATTPSTAGCPACSNTMTDAVGFELNTDQHMYAVAYKSGVRTAIADITASAPTDGNTHNYSVFYRPVKTHWFIDSQEVPVATGNYVQSALNKDSLPVAYVGVQGATTVATLSSNTMSVSDTAKNNNTFSDGIYGWRKATVGATNVAAPAYWVSTIPALSASAVSATTAGRGVPLAVDSTTGFLLTNISDGASYLKASVLANDTTAALNGLQVLPAIGKATPTAVTAGRGEMEQLDAATGGQYTVPIATSTATGFSNIVVSANTATAIKASAGNVYGISGSSSAATPCYVQFYNSAAPTCGTSVVTSIALPPTPGVINLIANIPLMNFATGIGVCFSTTQTGAVTCTGTLSATVFYK